MKTKERVPDDAHQELLNWGRWCNFGPAVGPGECVTVDRMYRPSLEEMDPDAEPAPPAPLAINHQRAEIVQAAWAQMPLALRLVLRQEYPRHTGEDPRHDMQARRMAARRLNMPVDQYERILFAAARKVEEAFDAVRV